MRKLICIITILLVNLSVVGQNDSIVNRKLRGPIWTTHSMNTDIVGVSLGAFPTDYNNKHKLTRTFGIRIEIFPLSPFYFLAPRTPISTNEVAYKKHMENTSVTQQIYGLNISTGTFEGIDSYGISLTGFMHYSRKNNGVSIAGLTNSIERANGIVASFGGNQVYQGNGIMIASVWNNVARRFNGMQIAAENYIYEKGRGVQIGVFNKAKNFRGIQLGIWNKNDKRSFPIINWQFKS
ncbi:LA_2272 family surface repeat-containing protein [Flavivirga spongiicola]|uniref:Exopolysaccharide biosynthesis protein YbjH n=1 Tax=Flavivirga spongiicola TaxID=421621 RepID=A0ABU7XVR0_9FLAO|nr:hypothetical protein [Flavivirga sp. MEBiC05379]MDO5979854.1 hypothetical protein [Flavivirga sp. MEBiC05379]